MPKSRCPVAEPAVLFYATGDDRAGEQVERLTERPASSR
jgi:hypothetical protein